MNHKGRGGVFEKRPLFCLSAFVGKSIYCKNRRYNLSCGRYIVKIADIFQVAVDIFEKSLI
ncbi:hypothetical protein FC699_11200 [Bacillus wiedmannii]|uniref:Uncharacterized protein n=1 Tax=Bacillus wiedmannii TaxID=1890302 RepID=A0A4U2N2I8_9BACI|nr:hypothetical protein FC694_04870 [Bacillus wiedmannii]TKI96193.1 hypothetical protein FC699_11200 [Bacillus wiedmannii]